MQDMVAPNFVELPNSKHTVVWRAVSITKLICCSTMKQVSFRKLSFAIVILSTAERFETRNTIRQSWLSPRNSTAALVRIGLLDFFI